MVRHSANNNDTQKTGKTCKKQEKGFHYKTRYQIKLVSKNYNLREHFFHKTKFKKTQLVHNILSPV